MTSYISCEVVRSCNRQVANPLTCRSVYMDNIDDQDRSVPGVHACCWHRARSLSPTVFRRCKNPTLQIRTAIRWWCYPRSGRDQYKRGRSHLDMRFPLLAGGHRAQIACSLGHRGGVWPKTFQPPPSKDRVLSARWSGTAPCRIGSTDSQWRKWYGYG